MDTLAAAKECVTQVMINQFAQPNDQTTRDVVIAQVSEQFDQFEMLESYTIVCDDTNNPQELVDRFSVQADITIHDRAGVTEHFTAVFGPSKT